MRTGPDEMEEDWHMPEISRFFGIVISMFFDDQNPPHSHARYGKASVAVEISPLA